MKQENMTVATRSARYNVLVNACVVARELFGYKTKSGVGHVLLLTKG